MNEFETNNLEMAKTDPQLDALLDEALAPEAAPAGLNDRIVAATVNRLPDDDARIQNPVLGHIGGGGFPWRSVAAVLLLGGVVGGLLWVGGETKRPGGIEDSDVATVETVQLGLDQLADAALQAESIDDDIALLSMQLSAVQEPGIWEQDALESLDTAIAFDEFDQLYDELDLYF
ncbi:MAG: hypothetical protein AAF333_15755 [Planctomycetota bacterium]